MLASAGNRDSHGFRSDVGGEIRGLGECVVRGVGTSQHIGLTGGETHWLVYAYVFTEELKGGGIRNKAHTVFSYEAH